MPEVIHYNADGFLISHPFTPVSCSRAADDMYYVVVDFYGVSVFLAKYASICEAIYNAGRYLGFQDKIRNN